VVDGVTAAYADIIGDEFGRSVSYAMGRIDDDVLR